jgi:hypothetical protein
MTLLTIEPLLNYSEEDINKEEEYLITHMAYSNTNTDKNDSSLRTELFPDVNSYIYASEKELLNSEDYDNSDDLLDYISL